MNNAETVNEIFSNPGVGNRNISKFLIKRILDEKDAKNRMDCMEAIRRASISHDELGEIVILDEALVAVFTAI